MDILNIITIMWSDDFKKAERTRKLLCDFLRERGLEQDFEDYYNRHTSGYNNPQNNSHRGGYSAPSRHTSRQTSVPPTEVVLFIKAVQGKTAIEHIKENNCLDESIQNDLVQTTKYLCFENNFDDSVFSKPESVSQTGPEYDFVAVKTEYPSNLTNVNQSSDQFTLRQLIKNLCKQKVLCKKISNRLPVKELERYRTVQVND